MHDPSRGKECRVSGVRQSGQLRGVSRGESSSNAGSSSRHSPGANPPSAIGPMECRTRRKVGKPTLAVMRRTCLFFPSVKPISSHAVGIDCRKRIGGSRDQRSAGSGIRRAEHGRDLKSPKSSPPRKRSSAASEMFPSTCAQYNLRSLERGSEIACCSAPSEVSKSNPSLSMSSLPAGYTSLTSTKSPSDGCLGCLENWHTTPNGLLNATTRGFSIRNPGTP